MNDWYIEDRDCPKVNSKKYNYIYKEWGIR